MAVGSEAIGEISPPSAVLFLGSGFSLESKNLLGSAPPNGPGLKRHFLDRLGLPPDTTYDLQVLADEFAAESGNDLYHELYRLFRIESVGPFQSDILKEVWLRIYTTNYDDTVELCRHSLKQPTISYSSRDEIPNRFPQNSVVHLHGSLRDLKEDNVLSQLVLGESSYVRQYLEKSPWYSQFQADIRYASKLFIVGYSLSDYHISALLLENPAVAERTFFIQSTTPQSVFERRTAAYGRSLFIGLDGFAGALKTLPRAKPITDVTRLKNFRFLDPLRDKKGLRPPTAIEVLDLFTYGAFNYSRCVATLPNETYVISRAEQVDQFMTEVQNARSVILDSRMGNGKTIFLYLAFLALAEHHYSCFLFKGSGPTIDEEMGALRKLSRLVIFFDQYTLAQDVLRRIADQLPDAKFVIEIRTSIFEVRYHEVSQVIPSPYVRISLNKLSYTDVTALKQLCSRVGISVTGLRQHQEMRDILLLILQSSQIRNRIESELKPIFDSAPRRRILLLTMLLSRFHLSVDPTFLKVVTGVDPYREFRPVKEIADEVFETNIDNFRARSALFSDFAVKTFVNADEIADCIVEAAVAAAARRSDRRHRLLMANLMQYSNLQNVFRGQQDTTNRCVRIYERLRHSNSINDEPLFWLQYAIAMAEDGQLTPAELFIETAYERAAAIPSFQTYQIDTQALRILLMRETRLKGAPVERIDKIFGKLEVVWAMLGEESHRIYAIKVVDDIGPFIKERAVDLTTTEKNGLVYWIAQLSDALSRLPATYKAATGSDLVKARLERARASLLS